MRKIDSVQEIGELKSVIDSEAFRNILIKHREHLQKQVNAWVRQQNIVNAFGELSKIDDIDKIFDLIELRIKEIEGK